MTRAEVIDKALDKESNPLWSADCESAARGPISQREALGRTCRWHI